MVHDDVRVGGREVSVKVGRVMGAKDSPCLSIVCRYSPLPASASPLQSSINRSCLTMSKIQHMLKVCR